METLINLGILICAIIALVFSFIELRSYKAKENSKLLSQLNKRYMDNNHIQKVVRYLRDFEASDEEPSAYETEVFLRYFEELGTYLRRKSLSPEYAYKFFSYYLDKYYYSDKGKMLQEKVKHVEEKLDYVKDFKKATDNYKINNIHNYY